MRKLSILGLVTLGLLYVFLLGGLGWFHRDQINGDAPDYLEIARQYQLGRLDVAVNAFRGPLLSWLLAPLLSLGCPPLAAARIVMGVSAVLFVISCFFLYRSAGLPPVGVGLGVVLAGLACLTWSVDQITPDLLVASFIFLSASRMFSPAWPTHRTTQFASGLFAGLAYLSKGVALPQAFLLSLLFAVLWLGTRSATLKTVAAAVVVFAAGLTAVAGPWVTALSLKYHRLMISSAGPISHAVVGPPDVPRYHPSGLRFIPPEPGLLFPDPTDHPYHYWSPLERPAYARHQLRVVRNNLTATVDALSRFDGLRLGLACSVLGLLLVVGWWGNPQESGRLPWACALVLCLTSVYLPVYAGDERYYYPCYPFLVLAALGLVMQLTPGGEGRKNLPRLLGLCLVGASFALPLVAKVRGQVSPQGIREANRTALLARELANKIEAAGVVGPVVDSNEAMRSEGAYVAFFLKVPYHGRQADADAAALKASGARIAVLERGGRLARTLQGDPAFRNLDDVLFDGQDAASQCAIEVYEILAPGEPPRRRHDQWSK
jgi:hypothetical protein